MTLEKDLLLNFKFSQSDVDTLLEKTKMFGTRMLAFYHYNNGKYRRKNKKDIIKNFL
jgi:hypothetical protein